MQTRLAATIFSVGLLTTACQQRDGTPRSTDEQVEQAQRESEKAFESARSAQEKAREEQADVTKAEQDVADKQRELAEAEAKLDRERQEAEQAQTAAVEKGTAAQEQAQSAQARASETQMQARREYEARRSAVATPRPRDQQVTQTPFANEWFAQLAAPAQSTEGILKSATGDEVIIERDDGSEMRFKVDPWATPIPSDFARVRVQYRTDTDQPTVTRIEGI